MIKDTEFKYLAENLLNAKYTFAKSMPKNPHWYTLRKDWADNDFVKSVILLRKYGYDRNWYGHHYTSFNLNNEYYWTMGEDINKDGKPWTILINKAIREIKNPYDEIADRYDTIFSAEEYKDENSAVMDIVKYNKGERILDIGCGTGLFLDENDVDINDYIGIDPSSQSLSILEKKHKDYKTINTEFENFWDLEKFDKIIALFGVGSYIDQRALGRIKLLLKEKGKLVLMYYSDNYYPVTYSETGITMKRTLMPEDIEERLGMKVKKTKLNNHIIVEALND